MSARILVATGVLTLGSALVIGTALAQQEQPAREERQRQSNAPSSTTQPAQETRTETQPATGTSSALAEMKTQTYKGVLVDATCAMPQAGTASTSTPQAASPSTTAQAGAATTPRTSAASADRAAGEQACPVSSSTNQFALKLQDGRVLRFDIVGNDRAQEAVKTKKKWSEAVSSGKTINAKVNGVMSGEKLVVSSIN